VIHSWTIDANIAGVKVSATNVMSVPAHVVAGVRAALAPLVTDIPIITLTMLMISRLSAHRPLTVSPKKG